jgi:hypothetical protein
VIVEALRTEPSEMFLGLKEVLIPSAPVAYFFLGVVGVKVMKASFALLKRFGSRRFNELAGEAGQRVCRNGRCRLCDEILT